MGFVYVDGMKTEFGDEKNMLEVIRKAGIDLPTFCHHSELSIYGACRMCVVENEWGSVEASCSMVPKDGMRVKTGTEKLRKYRKMILELLLSSHCRDCTLCEKNGNCRLQELADRFGIRQVRFEDYRTDLTKDESSPALVRDPGKCILCGDCVRMCAEVQGVGVFDFAHRGAKVQVTPAFDAKMSDTDCVHCGQCTTVCPTGALIVKKQTDAFWRAIDDKNKRVVVQVAPAVRIALGEAFGIPTGEDVMGRIVAALRKIGVDEVYDTGLAADLTVMEESEELLERLGGKGPLPLMTSCCPGWVRFVETRYPEWLPNVSSCRSPQQMMGAFVKEHHRSTRSVDGMETFLVALMPCTAKKHEAARPEFAVNGEPDVDLVVTAQEFASMIREANLVFSELEPEAPDMPFGLTSGAGLLFGVTGGVTEAVLRHVTSDRSPQAIRECAEAGVRGLDGIKETVVQVGDRSIRVAVVSGLKNAAHVLDTVQNGNRTFDFIEVMACPGGCINGAGQPHTHTLGNTKRRAAAMYNTDKQAHIKRSEENPVIFTLYNGVLKGKSHRLLHKSGTGEGGHA